MIKKIFFLSTIFLVAIFSTSCFNQLDVKERTAADEQIELTELLKALTAKGNNIDTTTSGVYYVSIDKGSGEYAKSGDTLSVIFAGYFNNSMFHSSFQNQTKTDSLFTFVLGTPPLIKGWDEGMTVLNKNAKAQFIIPSALAYGSTGLYGIPPHQPLIYLVKMKDIKPKK